LTISIFSKDIFSLYWTLYHPINKSELTKIESLFMIIILIPYNIKKTIIIDSIIATIKVFHCIISNMTKINKTNEIINLIIEPKGIIYFFISITIIILS
jgi:hypothetical protein